MDHRIEVSHRIDVDHRKLNKLGPKDVDHRNLISLTGSPKNETKPLPPPPAFVWPEDQDYRCKLTDTDFRVPHRSNNFSDVLNSNFNLSRSPMKVTNVEAPERKDVNVESIDMDVSEEDEEESSGLIQLEEDVDDRIVSSMKSSFLNQPSLNNFNTSSSFMDNVGSTIPPNEDVDERLKSIFGGVLQRAGGKLVSREEKSAESKGSCVLTEIRDNKSGSEIMGQESHLQGGIEPNGVESDFTDHNEYFRRESMWQPESQSEPAVHPCPTNVHLRGMSFGVRMGRNSPRPLRVRPQHRFPFRPHHPRAEAIRGRQSFSPRLPPPVRGGRW